MMKRIPMHLLARVAIGAGLVLALVACHRPAPSWHAVASESGCTPDLLANTPKYESTRVLDLVGSYRLVQVDTARGWIELKSEHDSSARGVLLRLWAADSINARSRPSVPRGKRIATNRPVVGALAGYDAEGFSPENPQVEVSYAALDYLTVRFTARLVFDGPLSLLPIQRFGSWGFGGYFEEGSYVVPVGRDGEPLGQRAGFYCAFRR